MRPHPLSVDIANPTGDVLRTISRRIDSRAGRRIDKHEAEAFSLLLGAASHRLDNLIAAASRDEPRQPQNDEGKTKNDQPQAPRNSGRNRAPDHASQEKTVIVEQGPPTEHIAQFFAYAHLPAHLQAVSKPFSDLATVILELPRNPERTVALRKLLESKDAAVRAKLAGA